MAVDAGRFLSDLHALRAIGARGPGVVRRAFDADDIRARHWLAERFAEAGLTPRIDPAGNVWGLRGRLLMGSHTDTQPEGGWLDGALGVIAALEVARGNPDISVVSFQDEEGRFGATTGSEIWSGALSLPAADDLRDLSGLRFGEARLALPATDDFPDPAAFDAYLEHHIEQGPVLDAAGEVAGIVTAIVGLRQITVTLTGRQNHAGTTPMAQRADAFRGLAAADRAIGNALAPLVTPDTVWTIGHITLHPNAPSAVPGRARFTVQWRDADQARLDRMEGAIRDALSRTATDQGLGLEVSDTAALPPAAMSPDIRAALCRAAEAHAPGRWREMPSGALHDATNVARLMPVGMLFAPSIGGISHDFAEDTDTDDLTTCLTILDTAAARLTA
ncbi:hydantoinase/carbamoylase family amidase [Jannaschia sp. S6380]|uniref:hydantoinase/carbamoylase family amidase n=1 Tax=Jannaschia sp. S6380 TaxID=2926408 RepID=UPI001FF13BC4|nr:hydantoinase/carbamoylase family amidase [Jannaschia sp. S6380]MCK0168920.1 hydantoinase/carbamoylase family amidase [Jannaschia sp. S6380]